MKIWKGCDALTLWPFGFTPEKFIHGGFTMKKSLFIGLLFLLLISFMVPVFADQPQVTVYTALQESDMGPISSAFEKATGVKMNYVVVGGAGQVETRILAEAGNPQADIFLGGSSEFHADLGSKGLLVKYQSANAKGLDKTFCDPDGYWQGWYMGVLGFVLNSDRYQKEMAPKGIKKPATWDDALNPAWKGYFVSSNPSTAGGAYIFLCNQIFRLGEDKAWNYFKKLNQNVNQYTPTAPGPITACATGEFILGMSWAHDIVNNKTKGYPIEVIVPKDTAFEIGSVSIIKNCAHLENAKKLVDWLLTKEAGELNTKNSYRYSVRNDVTPPAGMPELKQVTLVKYDRVWAATHKDELLKKWENLIQ
jgi:ABC-type Fe3+ transport system, periplasmic component